MILLPPSLVVKLIKKYFPDKPVSNDFKVELTKAVSLFILYVQNSIEKKKYGRDEILGALEKEGFARVAQDLRNNKESVEMPMKKRVVEVE